MGKSPEEPELFPAIGLNDDEQTKILRKNAEDLLSL